MIKVVCLKKQEVVSKNGKTLYFLDLLDTDDYRVYKALTTKKHFDCIEVDKDLRVWLDEVCDNKITGFINFNNGYTNFYLPKDKLNG